MKFNRSLYLSTSPGEDRALGVVAGKSRDYVVKRFDMGALQHEIYLAKVEQWSPAMNGFFLSIGDHGKAFMPLGRNNQNAFKPGNLIPVTVTRSAIDDKLVRVSNDIVLPSPRLLFIPSKPGVHLSQRAKVKSGQNGQLIIHNLKSAGIENILVRETAIGSDFQVLCHEAQFLAQMWRALAEEIRLKKVPGKLKFGTDFFEWIITNYLAQGEVFIGNEKLFNEYRAKWNHITPDLKDNIKLLDPARIDAVIQENLDIMLAKKITFGRIGEIVIEETEALTAIDVNAFAGNQKTNDRHQLNVNLNAIPEIIRQIRLRNLAGIIVIDFINMRDEAMNKAIEAEMIKLCADDPAEVDVLPISKLGLMQISRERSGASVSRLYHNYQDHYALSFKSVVLNLFRALSNTFHSYPNTKIQVFAQREFLEKLRAGNHIIDLLPESLLKNLTWSPDDKIDFNTPYYQLANQREPIFV
ncbi:MAG: ribonuclease G [Alphaproteobacteria bacterium]|jgi:ribonuclease G